HQRRRHGRRSADKYDASGGSKGTRAVRWAGSGTAATELGILSAYGGYTAGDAYGINDAGTAVGRALWFDASGLSRGNRAVRWDASGAVTELGNLGRDHDGFTENAARAINGA